MNLLCDRNYEVSLETSGSITCGGVDSRVKIILDVKTPSSGAKNSFLFENLSLVPPSTEFKFVISSIEDFEWAEDFSIRNQLFDKYTVLYSPTFDLVNPAWLAEKILLAKSRARLQLQLHKYIWSPSRRGV
jgi:7-carboxy-7-deazaguanine synthase